MGEGVADDSDWEQATKLMANTASIKGTCETGLMQCIIADSGSAVGLTDSNSHTYAKKLSITPAAMAEPRTPATLGPMACMIR